MIKKPDRLLYEILLEKGRLPKQTLEPLLREADTSGENLQNILIKKNILPEKDILGLLAEKLKLTFTDLKNIPIDKSVLERIPVKIASYYKFIPIGIRGRVLTIAVAFPLDIKTQDEIRAQLGYEIEFVLSKSSDILEGLKKHYGLAAETLDKISYQKVAKLKTSQAAREDYEKDKVEDIEKLAEDASVIKLVNQIILEGWRKRATDIHIEPYRGRVALRYRVDGLLYDANVPPEMKNFLNAIISRIKIMSNLDIVERRLPQDGRAIVRVQEQVLDLRISTIPTPFGEGVVVRILPTQMLYSLERLGLSKRDLKIFENLIQKPHGIVFVTGPTGSGKTTSLYACLGRINTKERKIITIEDPIEYEMAGITQMQVMPEIGLDFARGLRSILRHDPDVIMVGEVRDLETAEIAIRVALTGHLIFSTLHTNDAASGIARLIDIGVEPYLVASSVEAFIAQRLIRLICPDCKHEDESAPQQLKEQIARDLGLRANDIKIFRSKGCPNCNFTGFFGRTAIYEVLLVDDAMKELILQKAPAGQIKKMAVAKGMHTLREDGWQKVISGLTTPEEVLKVTSETERVGTNKEIRAFFKSEVSESGEPEERTGEFEPSRRVYQRLSGKVNLSYKAFKSHKDLFKEGFIPEQFNVTKNISAGGLLFGSHESMPVGMVLELKLELPDGKKLIECLGRVVRVEEVETDKTYNIAVCFLDMTGPQRQRLNKYVESGL